MITVYRNSVQSWEIDQMGHMNVQFYFEKALQGCVVLWNKLGINEKPVELGNTYLSLARAHIRFLKEQKPGAPFFFKLTDFFIWSFGPIYRSRRDYFPYFRKCFSIKWG